MYRPARISEFVTPAVQKRTETKLVNGRTTKSIKAISNLRGKFKQRSTTETSANGLKVVTEAVTYTTWWKEDLKAGDILEISGIDYQVVGNPENVEGRGRYAVLTLERINGGA